MKLAIIQKKTTRTIKKYSIYNKYRMNLKTNWYIF